MEIGSEEYWNNRYLSEKSIWGTNPAKIINICDEIFNKYNIRDILIMGIGYGRNGKYFSENNYNVDGIEISDEAIKIGKTFAPEVNFFKGNVLNTNLNKTYGAVFCYDIIQILLKNEREALVEQCIKHCKSNGLIMISCLSKKDVLYGRGKRIEENTFTNDSEKELHFHYSDEAEMEKIHPGLKPIKTENFREEYEGGITKDRIFCIYERQYGT